MKRTLRLFSLVAVLFLALTSSQKAHAQITALAANFWDSSSNYCNVPADVSGFCVYTVAGSPQTTDSTIIYINYGDGTDTTYTVAMQNQFTFSVDHTYMTTGNFQIQIILTYNQNTSIADTVMGSVYMVTNTCSALEGLVWLDNNSNCTYETGEAYMSGQLMKATNTTTNAVSYCVIDQYGMYHMEVPDNYTYDIELAYMPGGISPVCPSTGIATQAVSGTSTFTNNFGYDCNTSSTTDFAVYGSANFFRPGHTRHMVVYANTDNFCQGYAATVTLQLDPLLTCVGVYSGTPPTTNVGQTVTWNVANLSQLNGLWSNLMIYTDSAAVLGDTLCNMLYITYTGVTDPDQSNDTANICRAVSNSYDPNNKEVAPNNGPLGLIENGETLFYVVNFQNTGNDTAYDVVIVDTLSSNLDENSFELMGASHPVNVTWLPGNVINFRFEDIYLPDSNVNEPLSHGSVAYRINAKTGLALGTTVNNTAYIYFDFNPPIITNTTVNTIDIPLSVYNVSNGQMKAQVYPNPANDEVMVTTEGIKNFTAQVYDVLGRPVVSVMTNSGKANINTSALADGMYILQIKADGKEMSTKINIQH